MRKTLIPLCCMIISSLAYSQVGINTPNPQGIFHVDGAKDNPISGIPTTAQQSNDFTMLSTGDVGIGTSTPKQRLHIIESGTTSGITTSFISGIALTGTGIASSASGPGFYLENINAPVGNKLLKINYTQNNTEPVLNFQTVSDNASTAIAQLLSVTRSGKVGINNTTNPLSNLSVNGNASVGNGYIGAAAPTNGAIIQGDVGIGSSAPTRKLHVEGSGYFNAAVTSATTKNAIDINIGQDGFGYGNRTDNFGINIRSASSVGTGAVARINFGDINTTTAGLGKYLSFSVGNGLNELMYLTDNNSGRVGIGTTTPSEKLHVIGNILASGTVTPSDIRIKKDIVDNSYGLKEILSLRTINYRYKNVEMGKDKKIGFVAQEIKASMPELVTTANDEMKTLGVNYAEMTVVLTKAIQEQQKEIENLKEQIKRMQQGLKQ